MHELCKCPKLSWITTVTAPEPLQGSYGVVAVSQIYKVRRIGDGYFIARRWVIQCYLIFMLTRHV